MNQSKSLQKNQITKEDSKRGRQAKKLQNREKTTNKWQ